MRIALSAAVAGAAITNAPKSAARNLIESSLSGREADVVALARMPRNGEALDQIDGPEQEHADERQDHERREHGRQLEIADRALQHEAETRVGADELAHHGPDHGERDRDLEPGEHGRQRVRQADHAEEL